MPGVKIITVKELQNYNSIDEVMQGAPYVLLLYEQYVLNNGHWVGLLDHGSHLEHFDSYGIKPDMELKWCEKNFRQEHYGSSPKLLELLLRSKKKVRYNNHKLQKSSPQIATCGRWCVLRFLMKHLDEEQFAKLFMNKAIPSDHLCTLAYEILVQ